MELTNEQYTAIFIKFRTKLTSVADDATLKEWGHSEERIKEIKIRKGKCLVELYEDGMEVQRYLDSLKK